MAARDHNQGARSVSYVIRAIFLAALFGLSALPAFAGPAPNATTAIEAMGISALVHRIHGCHFNTGPGMEPDPVNGHHYHDRNCRVIRLGPLRVNDITMTRREGNTGTDFRQTDRSAASSVVMSDPSSAVARSVTRPQATDRPQRGVWT
jgi:hypothetical protein